MLCWRCYLRFERTAYSHLSGPRQQTQAARRGPARTAAESTIAAAPIVPVCRAFVTAPAQQRSPDHAQDRPVSAQPQRMIASLPDETVFSGWPVPGTDPIGQPFCPGQVTRWSGEKGPHRLPGSEPARKDSASAAAGSPAGSRPDRHGRAAPLGLPRRRPPSSPARRADPPPRTDGWPLRRAAAA